MKWQILILMLSICSFSSLLAQDETVLQTGNSCGLEVSQIAIPHMLEFSSNSEASAVMNDIMKVVGLRPNFTIQAADVPNAAAVVIGLKRYILYNPKFIKSVNKSTNSDWSAISILAHELGHHLNGHTLSNKGSRPRMELEADEFSGFVLRKMGASLEEAQIAMNLLASPYGSISHPAKGARLDAIKRGWDSADSMIDDYSSRSEKPVANNSTTVQGHSNQAKTTPTTTNASNNNTTKPSSPRPSVSHPSYAKYVINLLANPNKYYYLTHGNDFVLVRNGQPYPVGTLERNFKDENFPNVIRVKGGEDLYINKQGQLYTQKGTHMGRINRIE